MESSLNEHYFLGHIHDVLMAQSKIPTNTMIQGFSKRSQEEKVDILLNNFKLPSSSNKPSTLTFTKTYKTHTINSPKTPSVTFTYLTVLHQTSSSTKKNMPFPWLLKKALW